MSRLLFHDFQVVIGIETHAQIRSRQKLFSNALANARFNAFDAAFPGTLPKLNSQCVNLAIRAALALNCTVNRRSAFDRKHYFYPDLPAGYQITQHYSPFALNGSLHLPNMQKSVRIKQIQLEQDTGKTTVERQTSYVDLDRAGTGLLEIVTQPDLRSPEEAAEYVRTLQAILRATGVSDGNAEAGSFRCDVNVSIHRPDQPMGTRCEIKNLNSIRFMVAAINHEISRQADLIQKTGQVPQETRAFDQHRWETIRLRSKEDSPDYRYMPDPNLGTLVVTEEQIERVRRDLPPLPKEIRERLLSKYESQGVTENDIDVLMSLNSEGDIGFDGFPLEGQVNPVQYFEQLCAGGRNAKVVINWIIHSLLGELSSLEKPISEFPPIYLMGELVDLVESKHVTRSSGRLLLRHILVNATPPGTSMKELARLLQLLAFSPDSTGDEGRPHEFYDVCVRAIEALPSEVAAVRAGRMNVLNKIVGWVIRETRGRADASSVRELVKQLVAEQSLNEGSARSRPMHNKFPDGYH